MYSYVVPRATERYLAMEMSSDGGTGAQEKKKQVTVAYDGGGCKWEKDETMSLMAMGIYMDKRGGRQDATAGQDR